jgi:hypothetical protein
MWEIIPQITTPLSLMAFVIAALAIIHRTNLSQRQVDNRLQLLEGEARTLYLMEILRQGARSSLIIAVVSVLMFLATLSFLGISAYFNHQMEVEKVRASQEQEYLANETGLGQALSPDPHVVLTVTPTPTI